MYNDLEIINESMSNEFMDRLLRSPKYDRVDEVTEQEIRTLMENTRDGIEQQLKEGTMTSDISQFTPILLPIVRRIYPNLVAHHILGVQPTTMPTGFIYAWVNKYTGDGNNKVAPGGKCVICVLEDVHTTANVGDTVNTDGKLLHKEGKLALVSVGATEIEVGTTQIGGKEVEAVYTNEAAFGNILQNYTGSYTTAAGEVLGKDMRELGFEVTKKSFEVVTRAVKTPFTVEMYQDLKAQHGQIADVELTDLASYELQAEIDRECINAVNSWAKQLPDSNFNSATDYKDLRGRWEIERYRAEAIRIDKEAALIGVANKRGSAKTLIVSPKVAVMLRQLANFSLAPTDTNIDLPFNGGYMGTFDGRYDIIVDQYALSDYCTALYRGSENTDAIGFYVPYIPINFTRVTNPDSGQPAIIAKSRYAIVSIPGISSADSLDRANTYASSWGVDFSGTILH